MTFLVDPADLPPADRFRLWEDASWNLLSALRMRRLAGGPFRGRMSGYQLGAVKVFHMAGDRSTACAPGKRSPCAIPSTSS